MAYKFQFGQAILSGALDQEGDIQVKDQSGNTKILLDDNGIISGAGNFQTDGALVMRDVTRITAAGAASFTTIDAASSVTAGSSFIIGSADLDETDMEKLDGITNGTVAANKAVVVDGNKDADGFRNINGTGNLNMGTISMTGFSVDADGDTALKSLAVDNSSTIGCDADTDIMTLAAQSLALADDVDFNIAKAGGLQIAGSAVTSTAAELNFLDGSTAGTAVASKAVVLDASKDITGLGQLSAVGLSGSLRFSLDVEADGGLGMTPFQNTANVADLKISGAFMQAAEVAVGVDELMMLDADGSVKRESFADYATAIAGDGLAASSGVLSVSLSELTEAAVNVGADSLIFIDADGNLTRKDTFADYATAIAGDGLAASSGVLAVGVDDSSIELNSDALRIKADGVTGAMLAPAVAGVGLAQDGSGNLDLDLNELSAAAVDVSADSIAIIDATDDSSKKESIADLVAGMAGAGLSAASGQLSVQGNSVAEVVDGTAVSEGYNFATGSDGGTVTLPASPSVGDVVTVKNSSGGILVLARGDAGHDIDGQSAVVLESPFAAVTCVYMVANKWKIV